MATLQVSEDVFQRAISNLRARLDNVDPGRIIVETARMRLGFSGCHQYPAQVNPCAGSFGASSV